MSIKLMSVAWDLDVPQTEKMVLLCLCDFANDEGDCWPSVERMRRKCSLSERTVQRSIRKLSELGFIRLAQSQGRKTNVYKITLPTPSQCHPVTVPPRHPDVVNPVTHDTNPVTVSPKPSITINEPLDEDDFAFSDFVETWNEVAGELGLRPMRATKPRKAMFDVRKREFPDIEDWRSAFSCLRACKWMHGNNDRGWKANPDFFLKASNFVKLVENQYGQA